MLFSLYFFFVLFSLYFLKVSFGNWETKNLKKSQFWPEIFLGAIRSRGISLHGNFPNTLLSSLIYNVCGVRTQLVFHSVIKNQFDLCLSCDLVCTQLVFHWLSSSFIHCDSILCEPSSFSTVSVSVRLKASQFWHLDFNKILKKSWNRNYIIRKSMINSLYEKLLHLIILVVFITIICVSRLWIQLCWLPEGTSYRGN